MILERDLRSHRHGPRRWISSFIAAALVCITSASALAENSAQRNPMIHADRTRLVDGNGEPIQLRGVLLEGWLMWNGTLWGAGLSSETKLAERLEASKAENLVPDPRMIEVIQSWQPKKSPTPSTPKI